MKTNFKMSGVFAAVVGVMLLSASDASAAMFKLLGAMDMVSKTPTIPAATTLTLTGKPAFGGGAAAVFGSGSVGFELGAFYMGRSYDIDIGLGVQNQKYNFVHVPALVRFNLGRVVSLGVGGFFNSLTGNLTETQSGVTTTEPVGNDFKTSQYGAVASLGFDIPMGGSTGLVIDGRYALTLSETLVDTTTGNSWKPTDIQAFVGLRFGASK